MNLDAADAIARAVLYEGYILYPYRPSSLKNQQRWTFGAVFPPAYAERGGGDPCTIETQCLVRGIAETRICARVRFLHLVQRELGGFAEPLGAWPAGDEPAFQPAPVLHAGERTLVPWDEASEREVAPPAMTLGRLTTEECRTPIACPAGRDLEPVEEADGRMVGVIVRTAAALDGVIALRAEPVAHDLWRLTLRVENRTAMPERAMGARDDAQRYAFASLHAVLGVDGGGFVSLTDPPHDCRAAAEGCRNQGVWPVLVGAKGQGDTLLASPIILPDHPEIAPESPGDLYDGCEIDEILTLRILTLTDAEKREMAAADPRARAVLERTEALTDTEMEALHGALRRPGEPLASARAKPRLASVALVGGGRVSVGDRVRLNPRDGADIMDVVLKGMVAVVEGVERDFEDRVHVAVTVADDPGREFGTDRFPGHRFFFSPEELEPLEGALAGAGP